MRTNVPRSNAYTVMRGLSDMIATVAGNALSALGTYDLLRGGAWRKPQTNSPRGKSRRAAHEDRLLQGTRLRLPSKS